MDADHFFKIGAIFKLVEATFQDDFPPLEQDYGVDQMKEVDSMSDQDASLVSEFRLEYLFEDFLLDVGIEGRYGIIHEHDGPVRVHSSSETNSSFLTTGQVDTFFTNFGHVTGRKDLQVPLELADLDCFFVRLFIVW